MAPTTGVPALSRRTPAQEAAGVEAKAHPQKQRKTANMSALACERGEASLLTTDATDFFEGVIFISSLSVDFETGVAQSFWRRGVKDVTDSEVVAMHLGTSARKALSYEARIPLLSREQ